MKIKCPECDEVMVKTEEAHVCESCDHTLTLQEAEEMFDDGKLIGVLDEEDDLDLAEMEDKDEEEDDSDDKEDDSADDEEDMKKEESFNGYANKETWATTIIAENEYSIRKKIKEAHKKEKLDDRFVQSLVEGAKEKELSETFENITLESVDWSEVSDHFEQVMKESEAIGIDVATALFSDVELTEEQKDELVNVFETAVDIRVNDIKSGLLEDHEAKLAEAIEEKEAELETKTAEYVDVVVEEWYEDNRIAIEDSLKVEFTEDFLDKLHDLFVESYVHVPEDRFDVIEALSEQVTQLECTITESAETTKALEDTITEMKKEKSIVALTEGMVETEKEKLGQIIESVEFKDEEQFVSEVAKLKEAFISKADTHLDEEKDDKEEKKLEGIEADIRAALAL